MEDELKKSQGQSVQQALINLHSTLKNRPSVIFLSPISISLGRHLGRKPRHSSHLLQLTESSDVPPGSALIVCNSMNRAGYEDELEDARQCLGKQLKLKVLANQPSTCLYWLVLSTSVCNCLFLSNTSNRSSSPAMSAGDI